MTYKDVLENAAYEAANGSVPLYEYSVNVPQVDVDEEPLPFWDSDEDYMWDPSLGPVDLTDEEVREIMNKKDLDQFDDNEIIATVDKRGFILGIKKDGSTCELGSNGRCI